MKRTQKAGDRCGAGGCGGRKRDHGSLCTEREHRGDVCVSFLETLGLHF